MSVHQDNETPKVSNFSQRYHKTAFVIKFHIQLTHIPAIYEMKCAKTSNISKLIFFLFGLYYEGCFHANFRKINNSLFFTFYYVQFLFLLSLSSHRFLRNVCIFQRLIMLQLRRHTQLIYTHNRNYENKVEEHWRKGTKVRVEKIVIAVKIFELILNFSL